MAALGSPPLGLLIDKVGRKRFFMSACFVVFLIGQSYIMFYPECSETQENWSVFGLAFIGLGYCLYGNCLIASIPLVVKKKVTGTAFGIMQMVESIALAFFPLITGALIDKAPSLSIGYIRYSIFFVVISIIGLSLSFCLLFVSDKAKLKLDRKSDDIIVVRAKNGGAAEDSSSP